MGCLDNLVGIRGCGQTPAAFNVNDLTGINVPDFDQAISLEHKSAIPALQGIISFATSYVTETVNNYLGAKYELKSFIENDAVGYYYEDKPLISAQTGYLTGYEIRVDAAPYTKLFINGLRLFVNHSGAVPVYVYDLIQGKLLDTITVTAVAGEIVDVNEIDLSYATKKQRLHLFIGYTSIFESYQTAFLSPYAGNGGAECSDTTCSKYSNSHVYFSTKKIATGSAKIKSNLVDNTGCAGLSLNYSLQCSFTEVMCNARNIFAMPIMYKAGELIMKELKYSKRLTGIVTAYANDHETLMNDYRNECDKQLANILQNMVLPESECFNCTPKIKSKVAVP